LRLPTALRRSTRAAAELGAVFSLFRFVGDLDRLESYLTALCAIVSEQQLLITVTRDTDSAMRLLRSASTTATTTVWPLDRLRVPKRSEKQHHERSLHEIERALRQATSANDDGDESLTAMPPVVSPMSLISPLYHECELVLRRIFGGWMICATTEIGDRVVRQFKQSNVTLDGTKNVGSAVTGGYMASMRHLLRTKFLIQKLETQVEQTKR
jgi:hypothetical protein